MKKEREENCYHCQKKFRTKGKGFFVGNGKEKFLKCPRCKKNLSLKKLAEIKENFEKDLQQNHQLQVLKSNKKIDLKPILHDNVDNFHQVLANEKMIPVGFIEREPEITFNNLADFNLEIHKRKMDSNSRSESYKEEKVIIKEIVPNVRIKILPFVAPIKDAAGNSLIEEAIWREQHKN